MTVLNLCIQQRVCCIPDIEKTALKGQCSFMIDIEIMVSGSLRSLPERNSAGETIPVVVLINDTIAINAQLEGGRNGRERVDLYVGGSGVNIGDLGLAV